jgi:alpha-tubulin suppressor-like RCC1 family protein
MVIIGKNFFFCSFNFFFPWPSFFKLLNLGFDFKSWLFIQAVSIACGANHNLVLTSKNDIYSWGYGDMLALGHGKERDELVPKKLNFEKSIKLLALK